MDQFELPAPVGPNSPEPQEGPPEIERPLPGKRRRVYRKARRTAIGKRCTSLPLIVEIRKKFDQPYPHPQIILEHGWTIYYGDEQGNMESTEFINIRNQNDSRIGVAIPAEIYDCFIQGLMEIRKK
jgi:hypothetical protein